MKMNIAGTFRLPETESKATADCFIEKPLWRGRYEKSFECFKTLVQPAADECNVTLFAPEEDWKFREGAVGILGTGRRLSFCNLALRLIERGYTVTLTQAERIIFWISCSHHNGYTDSQLGDVRSLFQLSYFLFTETGDPVNSVAVVQITFRGGEGWQASVQEFPSRHRWTGRFGRLIVPNLVLKF